MSCYNETRGGKYAYSFSAGALAIPNTLLTILLRSFSSVTSFCLIITSIAINHHYNKNNPNGIILLYLPSAMVVTMHELRLTVSQGQPSWRARVSRACRLIYTYTTCSTYVHIHLHIHTSTYIIHLAQLFNHQATIDYACPVRHLSLRTAIDN